MIHTFGKYMKIPEIHFVETEEDYYAMINSVILREL